MTASEALLAVMFVYGLGAGFLGGVVVGALLEDAKDWISIWNTRRNRRRKGNGR